MKRTVLITLAGYALVAGLVPLSHANSQDFRVREISTNIFAIEDIKDGDAQLVIAADRGLVVLNSFWSETTAQRFKSKIIENLNRDDFLYLINMVDRLDLFGGNAAYTDIQIIGHRAFWDKYRGQEDQVYTRVDDLIAMWRQKENIARERMPGHEPGSEQAIGEQRWINTCKRRADELESGFSLVLPAETFEDRKTLNLGNITLNLIWFGRTGYDGVTVITIPESKVAIVSGFILHPQHLAPYPQREFRRMDVPRWIAVLEEILEGENAVETVLCGINLTDEWSRDRAHTHLHYIRELWNAVAKAEAEGKDIPEINEQLSLENEFAYVKEMQVYKDNSDDWMRPQHLAHIRQFFLQHKNPASEIIMAHGLDSVSVALEKVRRLMSEGSDIYIEESSMNGIGYYLLNKEKFSEAIVAFRLNVEAFPQSANTYDSYAEALMKSGDTENAIINYRKSLELNPNNTNAEEMLKELEKQ
ncbi:MAG: hypothetical protein JSU65_06195 [Candidatus Zixiibacteriota bacterium]|nr:MAG: hypothetical protein JSU65_06195 [candidate division Zixibacteria bacterium]